MQPHSPTSSASSAQRGRSPTQEEKHLFLSVFLTDLSVWMTPPDMVGILRLVCKQTYKHLKSGAVCSMKATCNPYRSGNVARLIDHITGHQAYLTDVIIKGYDHEGHKFGANLYKALTGCPRLERLAFVGCSLQRGPLTGKKVTDVWVELGASCPNLQYVKIERVHYGKNKTQLRIHAIIEGIAQMENLTVLKLVNCQLLLHEMETYSEKFAPIPALTKVITKLAQLRKLSLSENYYYNSNEGYRVGLFHALCTHPKLRSLELNLCCLSNEFLALLCKEMDDKNSGIRQLSVNENAFTARTELPQPDPNGCITSDALILAICGANLTELSLRANALCHSLRMSRPEYFKEAAFAALLDLLAWHPFLKEIDITGCGLTFDNCLAIISSSHKWLICRTVHFSIDCKPQDYTEISGEDRSKLVESAKSAGGDLVFGSVTDISGVCGPVTSLRLSLWNGSSAFSDFKL